MNMTASGAALVGLTAIIGCLAAVLTFAVLRFLAAARDAGQTRSVGAETAFLSAALQEAVAKLKAQERATAARADASERLSGEIITSLTAGLLVVGLEGDVKILNPAGRRILELPDSASAESYSRSEHDRPLFDVIDECLRTQVAIVRRAVLLPGVGRGVHLGVTVSPLFDDGGRLHGAICLFTDLTTVKDLEAQLRLKESLAAVGELTAGIAHEFRNGLATIQGYAKLLDPEALPEQYRPHVQGIRAETIFMNEVVTNFLNFARPAELALTHVDMRMICERAAEEIRPDARAAGGDITLIGEFGAVDGDDVLLRQAFSNLLRNAVEAARGAGVPPQVVIQSDIDQAKKTSRVAVRDNGPGVPIPLRDRVFTPFFTSKRTGTGLGLALVQKIIVFHNGRISVTSAPEGGAVFQVVLPLRG